MKILLSPAKSLDYKSKLPTTRTTQPLFLEEAALLNKTLEKKTKKQLAELMNISEKLAALNYQRFKDFELPFTSDNARPAIYAYAGGVYEGFDAYSLSTEHLDVLQYSVSILTAMYGIVLAHDLMQQNR